MRGRDKRLVRIARGLYRYGPKGTIYWCRFIDGKNVWRSLQTNDRKRAMAISAFNIFAAGQNGHTEITVHPPDHTEIRFIPPPEENALPSPTRLPSPTDAGAPQPTPSPNPTSSPSASPEKTTNAKERTGHSLQSLTERFRAESGHLALATRDKLDCHFKVAARYLDFDRDVTNIKLADLRKLKSQLAEGRKPSSVNDILFKALGKLFEIAVEDEIIDRSPLDQLKPCRKTEPDRQQPSWEQSQLIVDAVNESLQESGLIVGFMRNFGVGQAEIKHLIGQHIDVEADVIHFRRKKTGKPFDVPIFPHAAQFIEELKKKGRLQVGKPVVQWRNPRKSLATACEHLGLPDFEPRALRRCFIIHCLQEGIDPRVVAKWQGHKDAKLIFSVYGKFIDRAYEQEQAQRLVAADGRGKSARLTPRDLSPQADTIVALPSVSEQIDGRSTAV
jgi:integrase